MRTLIEIWEEIWGDTIPDEEEHKRSFRLLEDILKKINKYEDKEFLTDAISQSRSLNIIIKKLYFEFAPIEKRNVENVSSFQNYVYSFLASIQFKSL